MNAGTAGNWLDRMSFLPSGALTGFRWTTATFLAFEAALDRGYSTSSLYFLNEQVTKVKKIWHQDRWLGWGVEQRCTEALRKLGAGPQGTTADSTHPCPLESLLVYCTHARVGHRLPQGFLGGAIKGMSSTLLLSGASSLPSVSALDVGPCGWRPLASAWV